MLRYWFYLCLFLTLSAGLFCGGAGGGSQDPFHLKCMLIGVMLGSMCAQSSLTRWRFDLEYRGVTEVQMKQRLRRGLWRESFLFAFSSIALDVLLIRHLCCGLSPEIIFFAVLPLCVAGLVFTAAMLRDCWLNPRLSRSQRGLWTLACCISLWHAALVYWGLIFVRAKEDDDHRGIELNSG